MSTETKQKKGKKMNDKMNEEVKKMNDKMPAAGTRYFTIETGEIYGHFEIVKYFNRNSWFDKRTWENNNYFLTFANAKKVVDKLNKKTKKETNNEPNNKNHVPGYQ